jgi:hypothetical protein
MSPGVQDIFFRNEVFFFVNLNSMNLVKSPNGKIVDGLSKLLIRPVLGSTPFEEFARPGSASTNAAPSDLLLKSLLIVEIRRLFCV